MYFSKKNIPPPFTIVKCKVYNHILSFYLVIFPRQISPPFTIVKCQVYRSNWCIFPRKSYPATFKFNKRIFSFHLVHLSDKNTPPPSHLQNVRLITLICGSIWCIFPRKTSPPPVTGLELIFIVMTSVFFF